MNGGMQAGWMSQRYDSCKYICSLTNSLKDCGIQASPPTIAKAFREGGYGRYHPRYKPFLNNKMKDDRMVFCLWHETWTLHSKEDNILDIGGWDQVIFTDETSVIMGEHRGKGLITRTKDEEWDLECMEKSFKSNSTFMFWGSIAWGWKGPCHIYEKETSKARAMSKEELKQEDITRWIKEEKIWLAKQEAIDVSLAAAGKKRQGVYPQFCNSFELQLRSKGEGID